MAIPCKENCPRYYVGCHKNCRAWTARQQAAALDRVKKKSYLKETAERYMMFERQWYLAYNDMRR